MKRARKSEHQRIDVGKEIKRLGVIVEHTDHNISLVAEQYGDVKKTLDFHSKILESHTEMIGKVMMDMGIIKEDVEFIKTSLKRKVDIDEFAALERRVAFLEKRRS